MKTTKAHATTATKPENGRTPKIGESTEASFSLNWELKMEGQNGEEVQPPFHTKGQLKVELSAKSITNAIRAAAAEVAKAAQKIAEPEGTTPSRMA